MHLITPSRTDCSPVWGTNYLDFQCFVCPNGTAVLKGHTTKIGQNCVFSSFFVWSRRTTPSNISLSNFSASGAQTFEDKIPAVDGTSSYVSTFVVGSDQIAGFFRNTINGPPLPTALYFVLLICVFYFCSVRFG